MFTSSFQCGSILTKNKQLHFTICQKDIYYRCSIVTKCYSNLLNLIEENDKYLCFKQCKVKLSFCFHSLNINAYSQGIYFIGEKSKTKQKTNMQKNPQKPKKNKTTKATPTAIETCREISLQILSPNHVEITISTFTGTISH